jgi:hypothetical protein
VFNQTIAYRDEEVVSVFVRFYAPMNATVLSLEKHTNALLSSLRKAN